MLITVFNDRPLNTVVAPEEMSDAAIHTVIYPQHNQLQAAEEHRRITLCQSARTTAPSLIDERWANSMITPEFIALDFLLSIALFLVVNVLGERGLSQTYHNDVFASRNSSTAMFNIGYRILAPVVGLMAIVLVMSYAIPDVDLRPTFGTIVFYWILRFIAWIARRNQLRSNFAMFIAQSITSIAICWLLYSVAIDDPIGSLMPQGSDISLEFAVLVLLVVFQALSQSSLFRKSDYTNQLMHSSEEFLYQFERDFAHHFTDRIKEDIVLRMILYAFALTENHYRPATYRRIERIATKLGLQRFGIAKTTGVMQVTSNGALSDEESVRLAIPMIESIYDEYLIKSNKLGLNATQFRGVAPKQANIIFSPLGYSYELEPMCNCVREDIASLYGKYSGSNLVRPVFFFNCARSFVQSEDYESGNRIVHVPYELAPDEYGKLPADAWCRIGKADGFACQSIKVECQILSGPRMQLPSLLATLRNDNRFDGSLCFLYCTTDLFVTLVRKDHAAFSALCDTAETFGTMPTTEFFYRPDITFSNTQSVIDGLLRRANQLNY